MSHESSLSPNVGEAVPTKTALHQKPAARQFVKFCIVGLSSTIINFVVVNALRYNLQYHVAPALAYGFLLSCLNGFFWNRKWTFRHARGHSATTQIFRYIAVNIVGFILNCSIVVLLVALYEISHGSSVDSSHLESMFMAIAMSKREFSVPKLILNGALLVATGVVVFWNYFANRLWTFKHSRVVGAAATPEDSWPPQPGTPS